MRIDGPRNLESTAALSGSFSGSFRGAVSNSTPSANLTGSFSGSFQGDASLTGSFSGSFQGDASLTGSFSGSFSGSATGSFFGRFVGDGSDLTFVFNTMAQPGTSTQIPASANGLLLIISESGGGLRTTLQTSNNDPEIYYELVDIPNSKLENNTISGVALGSNLSNLSAGNGISMTGDYNGSTLRNIALDLSSLNTATPQLTNDFLIYHDASDTSTSVKKIRIDTFVANIAGAGLTATNGVLSTSDTTISDVESIYNTSLRIGYNASNQIDFSTAGQLDFETGGSTKLRITNSEIDSFVNIDMNNNDIFDVGSITATQGAFEGIAGKWQGTGTSIPTLRGDRIKGIPFAFTCERGVNSWNTGEYMAFGNGAGQSPPAGTMHGPAMPYDGKVLAAILSWDRQINFTAGGNTDLKDMEVRLYKNGNDIGAGTTQGNMQIDQTDGASAGYKLLNNLSNSNFVAGDVLNWNLHSARDQSLGGTANSNSLTPVFVMTFWVLFE